MKNEKWKLRKNVRIKSSLIPVFETGSEPSIHQSAQTEWEYGKLANQVTALGQKVPHATHFWSRTRILRTRDACESGQMPKKGI